nr:DNA polymerase III subunit delta' [Rhabdobacter roseus]
MEDVKAALVRAVRQNHVAHAQLFDGAAGGGALALALAFATYVNCEDKREQDACGRCASCVKMAKLIHPDLHCIFPIATSKKAPGSTSEAFLPLWRTFIHESPYRLLPDWLDFIQAENKQGNISVEEARSILRKLALKAYEGEYKILIIWKPELMNLASANALLKILEEPPVKTLFLLVSDQSDRLLTTLLSRTQRVAVPTFTDQNVTDYLQQQHALAASQARQIAYLCDGNLAEAARLTHESTDDRTEWFAHWMRSCYKQDLVQLVTLADSFDGLNKEAQKGIFEYTLRLFRDMLVWTQGAGELLRVPAEELAFVQNFAKAVPEGALERMVQQVNEAYYHVERNVRAKMVFLDLSLTVSQFFRKS